MRAARLWPDQQRRTGSLNRSSSYTAPSSTTGRKSTAPTSNTPPARRLLQPSSTSVYALASHHRARLRLPDLRPWRRRSTAVTAGGEPLDLPPKRFAIRSATARWRWSCDGATPSLSPLPMAFVVLVTKAPAATRLHPRPRGHLPTCTDAPPPHRRHAPRSHRPGSQTATAPVAVAIACAARLDLGALAIVGTTVSQNNIDVQAYFVSIENFITAGNTQYSLIT